MGRSDRLLVCMYVYKVAIWMDRLRHNQRVTSNTHSKIFRVQQYELTEVELDRRKENM